jgi:catechol 2,3-dioxygenase-like lactoylglutathione lyase family enzyme
MLRPRALDHVGLKVTDMDKTLDFYQRLGLTLLRTSGPNADGLRSAVIQPVGLDHFCLIVDAASVDDVIADLRQGGIDIVRGPVERRDGTAPFVHDPDGVRVELQLKKPTTA